jgi:uncharacterized protein (DUF1684 family)
MASRKDKEYEQQVLHWRTEKHNSRIEEYGWLALAGLYWLNEGRNLIGANPMCEVILPDRAPTFMGVIELKGKVARYIAPEGIPVKVNGRLAQKAILKSTQEPNPSFITWNDDLRLALHYHDDKPAIRVWDNRRPERFSLKPSDWFPINKEFRVPATYTPHPNAQSAQSEDTFGEIVDDRVDGFITFKFQGNKYKLEVSETKTRKLFVKFRDETSGRETYPPCRYYYTEPVDRDGKVILDFNFSYSPPCAFTEYATCIFAPPQNRLPFRIEAGEIYRG